MTHDPALEWLLADAKSQGLTLSEYERRYGVILSEPTASRPSPAALRIRRNEISAGLATDDEVDLANEKARRRADTRRRRRVSVEVDPAA